MAKPMPSGGLRFRGGEARRVDADQFAARVDQGAAGIAYVDGCIGLNEVFEDGQSDTPAGRADDAGSDALAEPVGIADGQYHVADIERIASAQADGRQVREVDLQQRQFSLRVGADEAGVRLASVGKLHHHLVRVADDMPIGHDEAVLADDHAGPQSLIHDHSRAQAAPLAQPRRAQAHDGRGAGAHRTGVAGCRGAVRCRRD